MLIGLPPFYHTNKNAMFQLILESEVKFPTQFEISEEAKDLITQVNLKQFFCCCYNKC